MSLYSEPLCLKFRFLAYCSSSWFVKNNQKHPKEGKKLKCHLVVNLADFALNYDVVQGSFDFDA